MLRLWGGGEGDIPKDVWHKLKGLAIARLFLYRCFFRFSI